MKTLALNGSPEARDGEMEALRFFPKEEIDFSMISLPIRPVVTALMEHLTE